MKRCVLGVAFSVASLVGQSATVLDSAAVAGDRLYFLSRNIQPGSNQAAVEKLFAIDRTSRLQLIAQSPAGGVAGFVVYPGGTRVGFGVANAAAPLYFEADLATGAIHPVSEIPGFSPNGRYRLDSTGWHDLATGSTRRLPSGALLSNDGSAVYRDLRNLYRVDPSGEERAVYGQMRNARLKRIDDNARYAIVDGGVGEFLVSLTTGEAIRFDVTVAGTPTSLVISPDGEWAAMSVSFGPRIAICRLTGRQCRTIVVDATSPTTPVAITSGGGGVWLRRDDTAIVYVDLHGSSRQVLLDCLPWRPSTTLVVAGSLLRFSMTYFPEGLLLDGQPIPWFKPDPNSGAAGLAQIPWNVSSPFIELTQSEHLCPFGPPPPLRLTVVARDPREFSPGLVPLDPSGINRGVFGDDWQLIDGNSRRARRGEILHIYATGLGPVDCDVRTGTPAPDDRLCRVTTAADWRWSSPDMPGVFRAAEVLFAGLAPGLLGVYQIDVRAPEPFPGDRNRWVQLSGFANVWLE